MPRVPGLGGVLTQSPELSIRNYPLEKKRPARNTALRIGELRERERILDPEKQDESQEKNSSRNLRPSPDFGTTPLGSLLPDEKDAADHQEANEQNQEVHDRYQGDPLQIPLH